MQHRRLRLRLEQHPGRVRPRTRVRRRRDASRNVKEVLQLSRRGVKGFQGGYFLVASFGAESDSVILVVIRCNGVPVAAVDLLGRSCKALA